MSDTEVQSEGEINSRIAAALGGDDGPSTQEPVPPAPDDSSADPVDNEGVEPSQPEEAAEDQQPEESTDEQFEELEHLGKTYEVPASLKKAFEANRALATKASQTSSQAQALLEQVSAQAQFFQAEAQFRTYAEQEMKEKVRLEGVIEQYKQLDWYKMSTEEYAEHRRNRDILAEQLAETDKKLNGKYNEYSHWRSNQQSEVIARGQDYLNKVIPNFNAEQTKLAIAQQAVAVGFTKDEIANMADPRVVVALHKAAKWDKLQAQKPGVNQRVSKAPPISRPGAQSSNNSNTAVKDKALRARLKTTGNVNDAAALLLSRMR
jgi:hypothetical protein